MHAKRNETKSEKRKTNNETKGGEVGQAADKIKLFAILCVCVCLSQCILCNNNLCELFSAKGNKGGAAGRAARASSSSSSASSSHNLESQVENVPAN